MPLDVTGTNLGVRLPRVCPFKRGHQRVQGREPTPRQENQEDGDERTGHGGPDAGMSGHLQAILDLGRPMFHATLLRGLHEVVGVDYGRSSARRVLPAPATGSFPRGWAVSRALARLALADRLPAAVLAQRLKGNKRWTGTKGHCRPG